MRTIGESQTRYLRSGHGGNLQSGIQANARYEGQEEKINVSDGSIDLDLFSTSPTYSAEMCFPSCVNHAPFFAFNKHDKVYGITQGCCNDWNCPRCGLQRAKQEYGRIVEGLRTLGESNQIFFITITCLGRGMSVKESEEHYGDWTNRLLDMWRLQSKRIKQKWAYVQVTERQKRGHPHSHILTTFNPLDIVTDWKKERVQVEGRQFMAYVSAYRSEYIQSSIVRAGLGTEYDISPAGKIEAVSRYVAKYLFKDNIFNDVWPKGWRRVRYSQSFPKLKREKSDAFVLLKREDWARLASVAVAITVDTPESLTEAEFWLKDSDMLILGKGKMRQ